jgi:tryptophanyl-tRNA synthetase
MSGMRPTGQLHLGHLFGTLALWTNAQNSYEAFFEIANLHAFTTRFDEPQHIHDMSRELLLDWLSAGVDPERSTIFLQSAVPEISELHAYLSMIVPVAWLQRVPTYKDQIAALGPEIATYGFLGYPLLQLCDIAVFRAGLVPVGKDQLSHLELAREIVRRFNGFYGDILVEPQAQLSEFPDVPGIDGRKMSKSYGNAIALADDTETTTKRVRSMITDPEKIRRNDPGRPEICPVFKLHTMVNAPRTEPIAAECRAGTLGCVDCKTQLAQALNTHLAPIRERRTLLAGDMQRLDDILKTGNERARLIASDTLRDVRKAMKLG